MYELMVIIGMGMVIVGMLRGLYFFMEGGFGDGGGCMFLVSFKIFVNFL